jgi:hypothetical protein
MGRVMPTTAPAAELATIVHSGPHDGIDRVYGILAAHVAEHGVAVDGPLREYYWSAPATPSGREPGGPRSAGLSPPPVPPVSTPKLLSARDRRVSRDVCSGRTSDVNAPARGGPGPARRELQGERCPIRH